DLALAQAALAGGREHLARHVLHLLVEIGHQITLNNVSARRLLEHSQGRTIPLMMASEAIPAAEAPPPPASAAEKNSRSTAPSTRWRLTTRLGSVLPV
ncbi:hypothetical protein, partial [Glaesserella parasuis]|uniref:hypothetical protein n=1 Tax=Glaesserella parasuis TaxID=738 RepID=UPI003B67CEFF